MTVNGMDDLIRLNEKAKNVKFREDVNIVIVGHVDHGKSTITGRLLADNHMLPDGKIEQIKERCRRNSKPFEYAFLLDALKDEQSQGITIDTARAFFSTEKRNYIILDAPGHVEFLKNMVTGASRAEAALMVIDANEGIMENSKRHGYLLSMLGVRQIAVLVNKMDIVGYSEERFEEIKKCYSEFLREINVIPEAFIPVSGMCGDNIVLDGKANMPWYNGRTVIEQLESFRSSGQNEKLELRLPVQDVYKFTSNGDDRRIIAGTVETGKLSVGDSVVFYPSGKKSKVRTIEEFNAEPQESVSAGKATGFTMTDQIYARRGDVVTLENEKAPIVSNRIKANIFWLGRKPLDTVSSYKIKLGTAKVNAKIEKIESVLDASTLERTEKAEICRNEVGECIIRTERPVAFDTTADNPFLSRLVIIDNYEISGGGIVTGNGENGGGNITRDESLLRKEDRVLLQRQKGAILWFTGLSGAGKSTIANILELRLNSMGYVVSRLDGDNLRFGLNKDCDFTAEGRRENIRRAGEVAKLFAETGIITLCTFISPEKQMRDEIKSSCESFCEIYVKASVDECEKRDPKGLYRKARSGEIKNFTGITAPYEAPEDAWLTIDTEKIDAEEAAEKILNLLADEKMIY